MKLKKRPELKVMNTVALVVALAILAMVSIVAIRSIIKEEMQIVSILMLIICLAGIIYGAIGYKLPHGNLVKFMYFIYGGSLMLIVITAPVETVSDQRSFMEYLLPALMMLASAIIFYMSGRLDRIEKNRAQGIAVFVILIVVSILLMIGSKTKMDSENPFIVLISMFMLPLTWLGSSTIYLARHYKHKQAGKKEQEMEKKLNEEWGNI